jgi:hypothetical protein
LIFFAKSIPCCRAGIWSVSSKIGAVLCPAAKGFQCAVLFQLRRSCGGGTGARGCSVSMLDTNTVINA